MYILLIQEVNQSQKKLINKGCVDKITIVIHNMSVDQATYSHLSPNTQAAREKKTFRPKLASSL